MVGLQELYILNTWSFIRYMICKYFLPFCGLSFHFFDGNICKKLILCSRMFLSYDVHCHFRCYCLQYVQVQKQK